MKAKYFIAILWLVLLGESGFSQTPIFRHYDIGSGNQAIALNTMIRDPYGIIWVGSSKGLYYFDGSSFHSQPLLDSVPSVITALYCDSNDLWIGFKDGKLGHRSLKIWKKHVVIDTSLQAAITEIVKNAAGDLCIATYGNGIFIKHGQKLRPIITSKNNSLNEIYAMVIDKNGVLWVGTDEGLTRCEPTSKEPLLKTFGTADGLPDQIVKSIALGDDGKLWLGMYDLGVCLFDPLTQTFTRLPFSHNWKYGPVTALAIQNNKRLMIGTSGKGLISIALQAGYYLTVLNESTGYGDEKILDLMTDEEGNFWASSGNSSLDLFPALIEWVEAGKDLQAVLFDSQNNLWYASLQGLFRKRLDTTATPEAHAIHFISGEKIPVITSLFEDANGNVWAGTFEQGVFCKPAHNENFIQLTQRDGLTNDNVLSVSGDLTYVWISTLGGVSRCNLRDFHSQKDFQFKNFNKESGLSSSYIYQTYIDSKGRTWFATGGEGLKLLSKDGFRTFDTVDSIHINDVQSITEDQKGNIWFSTPNDGLFRFDEKDFRHYDYSSDLSDLAISGIIADENNDIVILENDGIEILEARTNQIRRYRGRPFFNDISPNLNAFCKDRFGNIWIATKKGILKYYPPSKKFSDEARILITQTLVLLQPVNFDEVHDFPYNSNQVTFDYQGFWNYNPSQVRYRYMLEGYDADWVKTKDERVTYPNLPTGTYTFKVQATIHHNFDDAATAVYTFTIHKPYWATWWFISLMVLFSVCLFYLIIREIKNRTKKEEKIKRERIEFQLENLKTQINPHFLFNSFNTLATLIEEDQDSAVLYVNHLADFYRSILRYKDTDTISLREECELTASYVFLLQQRNGNSLQTREEIREEDKDLCIPPLTLQLLVENAVKHNVVSKANPLTIEIFSKENHVICVRNNLRRRKEAVHSTGLGLKNINFRFEILGGKNIEVKEDEKFFEVNLPLIKNNNSHEDPAY